MSSRLKIDKELIETQEETFTGKHITGKKHIKNNLQGVR